MAGWFGDERATTVRPTRIEPPPAAGRPYPNLGTVPRPPAPRPARETAARIGALAADRQAALGGAERLTRGDATATAIAAIPAAPPPPADLSPVEAPVPPAVAIQNSAASVTYLAASIPFAEGSAAVGRGANETLRDVAARVPPGGSFRVVGHASRGAGAGGPASEAANLDISRRRAEAVAQALAQFGAPAARIAVEAAGDTQPIFAESDPAGAAGNRRVEIFVDY